MSEDRVDPQDGHGEIRSRLFRSTASNYVFLLLRLIIGVLLTRVLFLSLPRQEYGFWVLMWSVFGYALLLDFGFGSALQKYASQATVHGDWSDFNRRFSTVFFVYCGMSVLIAVVTLGSQPILARALRLEGSPEHIAHLEKTFLLFGLGRALLFPLGAFAEVLTGLHRIHLRNVIAALSLLVTAVLLMGIVQLQLGLVAMVAASLVVELTTYVAMAVLVRRVVSDFRIGWGLFDRRLVASIMSFCIFAYMITLSHLVILQTDELVISALLSVSLVGTYHVVWRVSNIFQQASTQLLDGLGPVAATLFQSNDHDRLKNTLLQSGRVVGAIATFLFVPLLVYLKPLLKIWLELESPSAYHSGILLLVSAYLMVVFKMTTARVLLMCEREKILAVLALAEGLLNLGLSVVFCLFTQLGIVGVALGTLIPSVVLAAGFYTPLACRFASVSAFQYLRQTLSGVLLSGGVAAVVYVACREAAPPESLGALVLNGIPGTAVLAGSFLLVGMNARERQQLYALVYRGALGGERAQ